MLNGNYTSVYGVIERVYEFFDEDIMQFSELVGHVSDALLLIGTTEQMNDEVEKISMVSQRGALPNNLVYVNQVRTADTKIPLRYTGNPFHSAINPDCPDIHVESSNTYSLNNSFIFTNFDDQDLEISFRALPVDEKGFPLIPDDIKFKMAMESYLMERIGFKLNLLGRLSENKYERLIKERDWYMGAAQSRGKMPSVDKMETIKNAFSRLLTHGMAHSTSFTSISDPETYKIQPYNRR